MYGLLGIYIKTLYNGVFKFYQNEFIYKLLEAAGVEHCNFFQNPPMLRQFLGHMRMVLRLIDIDPTHMLML